MEGGVGGQQHRRVATEPTTTSRASSASTYTPSATLISTRPRTWRSNKTARQIKATRDERARPISVVRINVNPAWHSYPRHLICVVALHDLLKLRRGCPTTAGIGRVVRQHALAHGMHVAVVRLPRPLLQLECRQIEPAPLVIYCSCEWRSYRRRARMHNVLRAGKRAKLLAAHSMGEALNVRASHDKRQRVVGK